MADSGPWDKYSQDDSGPWQKYGSTQSANTPEEPESAISRFGSGIVSGAKAMIPGAPDTTSVALSGMGPLPGMLRSAYEGYNQARSENQPILSSIASGAGSMLGLDPEGIRQRASRGDVAGIMGEAVPSIAATLIGGEHQQLGDMAQGAKESLGRSLRETPTSDNSPTTGTIGKPKTVSSLKPAVKAVGGVAKLVGGPNILNAIIPEHPEPTGPFRRLSSGPVSAIRDAQESGAGSIGGTSLIYPEPKEPLPSDKPGAMYSVKRKTTLEQAARRGQPGAGDVLRNIGKPILYAPKEGIGYPGARGGSEGIVSISGEPSINGSGESAASLEGINRASSEKSSGVKYFTEDTRSGQRTPISSIDANQITKLGPNKRIIRSGPEGESVFK